MIRWAALSIVISGFSVPVTAGAQEPPPPPSGSPPPEYYVQPAPPATQSETTDSSRTSELRGGATSSIVIHEPPPPPEPRHRAPKTAVWAGARLGWFFPFGAAWLDGNPVNGLCCEYRRRPWSDYASSGPVFELDVGARFARYYNVFLLWEHAAPGPGKRAPDSFGGQERGLTDLYAVGFRFSSDPDDIGLLVEIALGYRRFVARWSDGTELKLSDGMFDARIGLGADIRLSELFSLSPLVSFDSGVFTEATWSGRGDLKNARTRFDENAKYAALTVSLGGHFDLR